MYALSLLSFYLIQLTENIFHLIVICIDTNISTSFWYKNVFYFICFWYLSKLIVWHKYLPKLTYVYFERIPSTYLLFLVIFFIPASSPNKKHSKYILLDLYKYIILRYNRVDCKRAHVYGILLDKIVES